MSPLHTWLLGYLVNSLWQLPLLFAAAWLASQLLRSSGSAAQHRVWVSALLLEAFLPAIARPSATWLRSLPLWRGVRAQPGSGHITVSLGPVTGLHLLHLPAALLWVATLLYLAGLAFSVVRFCWLSSNLAHLRREAMPLALTDAARRCWRRSSQHVPFPNVQLASSSGIFSPVTIGLRHPLILLPLGLAEALSESELDAVLAHELAHVRRRDFLKNLLYEVVALPVRYHPCLWLTRRYLVESREMIADELASRLTGPAPYAHSLLRLASLLLDGDTALNAHAIGIFDAHTLERRLMKLTQLQTNLHGIRRSLRVVLCATLALGVCGSALALRLNLASPAAPSAAAPASASPAKVSSGVMAGQVLTHVNPVYPEAAKASKIQGAVVLQAIIGKDGAVEKLEVVSGPKELRASALDAVRQWVYKPYLLNGDPTEVETTVTINYSL